LPDRQYRDADATARRRRGLWYWPTLVRRCAAEPASGSDGRRVAGPCLGFAAGDRRRGINPTCGCRELAPMKG